MRRRPLGKTGIEVSELGLGTWGLSGDGYGPLPEGEADRAIERALEFGINLFDTADAYGKGAMERRLARLSPETSVVVTKIGTDRDEPTAQKRFDPTYLRIAFERCQERFGRQRLDVVLLHNPTMRAIDSKGPCHFLRALKQRNLVRAWGVSAGSVEVAREAAVQGAEVIELAYNAFFASDLHDVAGDLVEAGVGVLARSVLAHGLLTGSFRDASAFTDEDHRQRRWTTPDLRKRRDQVDALRPLVTGDIASLRSLALRYVLANDVVSSAILGPRSVKQLEELVADAGEGPPYLRDTVLAELAARLGAAGIPV